MLDREIENRINKHGKIQMEKMRDDLTMLVATLNVSVKARILPKMLLGVHFTTGLH